MRKIDFGLHLKAVFRVCDYTMHTGALLFGLVRQKAAEIFFLTNETGQKRDMGAESYWPQKKLLEPDKTMILEKSKIKKLKYSTSVRQYLGMTACKTHNTSSGDFTSIKKEMNGNSTSATRWNTKIKQYLGLETSH